MKQQTERFNTLIEFIDTGLYAAEEIVKKLDETYGFDHDDVIERYDTENKVYDVIMHCNLSDDQRDLVKDYLDNNGFKDNYYIYNRLSN